MPLFRATIRKAISGSSGLNYKWSNVYYVERASIGDALASGQGIWTRERVFHNTDTFCYLVYVSDLVPNTDVFLEAPPPAAVQFGLYASAVGEWYHSSIVQRVDYTVASSRPSRKFYRIPFREADVTDGRTTITAFSTALTTGVTQIVQLPEIRDVDGQLWTGASNRGITTRRLGREAGNNVPNAASA